jgi:hypothetical protein
VSDKRDPFEAGYDLFQYPSVEICRKYSFYHIYSISYSRLRKIKGSLPLALRILYGVDVGIRLEKLYELSQLAQKFIYRPSEKDLL